ncbi:hypothetical protein HG530_013211 [Fusarium avenaceum]|nr:hypothetical protein HG530_013211 [Fusarium avenaceum]
MDDGVGREAFDAEHVLEPIRIGPLLFKIFKYDCALHALLLIDLIFIFPDGIEMSTRSRASNTLDNQMAKSTVGSAQLRLFEKQAALRRALGTAHPTNTASCLGVGLQTVEIIRHRVGVRIDAKESVVDVETNHFLEKRLILEPMRFASHGMVVITLRAPFMEDTPVGRCIGNVNYTSRRILPAHIDGFLDTSKNIFRHITSTASPQSINKLSNSFHISGKVNELDIDTIAVVFVSNHSNTNFCLVVERLGDILHDSLDLLLGSIDIRAHRRCSIHEEEHIRGAGCFEHTLVGGFLHRSCSLCFTLEFEDAQFRFGGGEASEACIAGARGG